MHRVDEVVDGDGRALSDDQFPGRRSEYATLNVSIDFDGQEEMFVTVGVLKSDSPRNTEDDVVLCFFAE